MIKRTDLDDRLPIVYNGRSAEEWYHMYCKEIVNNNKQTQQTDRERKIFVIQNSAGWFFGGITAQLILLLFGAENWAVFFGIWLGATVQELLHYFKVY